MDKKVKDLRTGDRITINEVTATISSVITVDGKTLTLCEPIPFEDVQKMAGAKKDPPENSWRESKQNKWLMSRFMRGDSNG